jgi:ATP-dependent DNA helicase RecG
LTLTDSAELLDCLFFNQPWLRERFALGDELELVGRAVWAKGPALVVRKLGTSVAPLPSEGTLSPVYPATDGLSQDMLRALCARALEQFGARVRELVDPDLLARHDLLALPAAVRELHAPTDERRYERARRRLGLEPLIALRASIEARRRARAQRDALVVRVDDVAERSVRALFPVELTRGQLAVTAELRADLARGIPMRRLIQGDVGSGKTVLGAYACLLAHRAGAQSAFLAPTELLAEPHLRGLAPLLARCALRCSRARSARVRGGPCWSPLRAGKRMFCSAPTRCSVSASTLRDWDSRSSMNSTASASRSASACSTRGATSTVS